MLYNEFNKYESEFIKFLQDFEKEISRLPSKQVRACINPCYLRLQTIFNKYIKVGENEDLERTMSLIETHKIDKKIKNMIVSMWVYELDKLPTYENDILRQRIVEDYIFKVVH